MTRPERISRKDAKTQRRGGRVSRTVLDDEGYSGSGKGDAACVRLVSNLDSAG